MPPANNAMPTVDAILGAALTEIRLLIETAVNAQDYSSLAQLGTVAEGLTALRRLGTVEVLPTMSTVNTAVASSHEIAESSFLPSSTINARRRVSVKASYPRFERQGDRLVKVGWSKRDGAEYEHKAPRNVVDAVVLSLSATKKKLFTIEELLPLRDAAGADVPSYQAYMVIAWLRHLKIVERRGNEGYAISREKLKDGIVEREWKSLTSKEATENVG